MIATLLAAPACSSAAGPGSGGSGGGGTSASTSTGTGVPETCADGMQDGDETDVDCGGKCAPCGAFAQCFTVHDCAEGTTCTDDQGCQFPGACDDICAPLHQATCDAMPCEPGQFCISGYDQGTSFCYEAAGPGEPCNDDYPQSCVDGYFCDTFEGCKPKVPAGGACSETAECPDGYYCSITTNKCSKQLGAGKACMVVDACNPDLYCDFTLPGQALCAPRGAAGESCHDALGSCQGGLHCVFAAGLPCTAPQDCSGSATCCATTNGAVCQAATPDCMPPSGTCQ